MELGFPVSAPLPPKGNIRPGTLPGGKMAAVMHVRPYDQLPHAFHALQAFIEKQGLATTGIWYEMYANDPREVPPEQYQTLALIELK
ncbi:MAG: GyrI-like domain-containing protein [Chloroflexi bacterium]|nr:GyrI-like domain-containing protein [Chloroflexota bacterium]